ncbi:hypothetical protein DAEQUDRAFT_724461 [Daedalea quercina L-15889]|uniref:Uncharacterized protein n=1 Tax=Daedalea quercina L-15889 TaxID=1314783 RepID=A0A165RS83_9APHY|nr:hypothetical protein DAEQUDRAFT_724461 [Daedalea quercina L-15889]
MRLSSFIPFALVAASSVAAYSADYYSYVDADLALAARDLHIYDLVARKFLADPLIARTDEPKREHYQTHADYDKAWRAWSQKNRKTDHQLKKILQHTDLNEPQRDHYKSQQDYEKA